MPNSPDRGRTTRASLLAKEKEGDKFSNNASTSTFDKSCDDPLAGISLPRIHPDGQYEIDVFTAASLNDEGFSSYLRRPLGVVNEKNSEGWTPLMYAAYLGHKEISEFLLANGASPTIGNKDGQTPLMLAASCGSVDVARSLLARNADVNQRDNFGRTSLHYALKYTQTKLVEMLLECGAYSNMADFEGNTPTLIAIKVGNEATVSTILLKYEGNPYHMNERGETGITLSKEHPKIAALLDKICRTTSPSRGASQIERLFDELGLGKYAPVFVANSVLTLDALSRLSESQIEAMGVTLFGPKKKILSLIAGHVEKNTAPATKATNAKGTIASECQIGDGFCQDNNSKNNGTVGASSALNANVKSVLVQEQLLLEQMQLNIRARALLLESSRLLAGGSRSTKEESKKWESTIASLTEELQQLEEMALEERTEISV